MRRVRSRPRRSPGQRRSGRLARSRQGRDGGRLAAPELVAGVSAAVSGGPRPAGSRSARAATRSSPPRTRSTTASPSSRTTPSRYLRFDSSFQSGMYLDDPYRTRFIYSDYLQLPFAYRAQTRRLLYVGLGGGSAPKRDLARLPRRAARRRRARPGGRRHGVQVLRAAPRSPAGRRGRGRSPLRVRPRRPLGRDRHRRVLLRCDPVPPRDPGVPRARPVAARSRRESSSRTSSAPSPARTRVSSAPCFARTAPSSRPSRFTPWSMSVATISARSATSSSWPVRGPRRRSSSCATAGGRSAAALRAHPTSRRRSKVASMHRPDAGRAGADRRLCADRRFAAPLRLAVDGRKSRVRDEVREHSPPRTC